MMLMMMMMMMMMMMIMLDGIQVGCSLKVLKLSQDSFRDK